jgi:phospholipid transport system substrate-binding protein
MSALLFLRSANKVAGLRSIVCALTFVAIGALAASDAHAANSAEIFVQSSIDKTYAILNEGALSSSERARQFHALLLSVVDVRRVALFTLGPYARNAAPADVEIFERAFAEFLSAVYQRGLESYAAPKVTGSTERAPDDVIVNVSATAPNGKGPQLRLAFRVRGTSSGEQSVTDLQVEGAWLAIVQRGEFTAYLQQHKADIASLGMELEKRTAQLRLAQSESEIHRRER